RGVGGRLQSHPHLHVERVVFGPDAFLVAVEQTGRLQGFDVLVHAAIVAAERVRTIISHVSKEICRSSTCSPRSMRCQASTARAPNSSSVVPTCTCTVP